jgi:2-polyprenyl-6-methoxyphenol hydroxylase-like FAD-dependent oxidoreductase
MPASGIFRFVRTIRWATGRLGEQQQPCYLVNTVRSVHCPRWYSGRLALLGDAAHAMPPNLGQGANSALVDGVVLAEELARAPSVTDALVGYDKRRRPLARCEQTQAELAELFRVGRSAIYRTLVRMRPAPPEPERPFTRLANPQTTGRA